MGRYGDRKMKQSMGVKTHFWNRIECRNCGRKHFIFTFEHWNTWETGKQWFKKCKCGIAINID